MFKIMYTYIIYFQLFGKKLKKTILAKNEIEAKEIIKKSIKFDKLIKKPDKMMDFLNGFNK